MSFSEAGEVLKYLVATPPEQVRLVEARDLLAADKAKIADKADRFRFNSAGPAAFRFSDFNQRTVSSGSDSGAARGDSADSDSAEGGATAETAAGAAGSEMAGQKAAAGRGPGATETASESSTAPARRSGSGAEAVLFPRPYENRFSDQRLLLFFPVEPGAAGVLSGSQMLLPIDRSLDFKPPVPTEGGSSASYRRIP